jgi:hypothetical protein
VITEVTQARQKLKANATAVEELVAAYMATSSVPPPKRK